MQSSTPKLLFHFTHSFSFLSRSSSLALSLPLIRFRGFTARAAAAAIDLPDKRGKGDTFFAQETVSWKSLGLTEHVSQALSHAGFDRPSLIQVLCFPFYLSCIFIFHNFSQVNLKNRSGLWPSSALAMGRLLYLAFAF